LKAVAVFMDKDCKEIVAAEEVLVNKGRLDDQ
jgi:hypothetical protein